MDKVRLRHPNLDKVIKVSPAAVGEHAKSGWIPVEGEAPPTCPTCHQVWPAFADTGPPEQQEKSEEAPTESGASASKGTRRRRTTSEESE